MNQTQDELKSLNSMNKLILLPSESQKKLNEIADKNHQLHLICESQNVLLSQFSDTYTENLKAEKKITEIDEKIKDVDTLLANANYILSRTLTKESKEENEVGDLLKTILEKIKFMIISICNNSLKDGLESVSIMTVIDIEQQVKKIIDDLISNGMYLESESEKDKRTAFTDAHNQILLTFLTGFVNEAKRNQ